MRLIRLFTALFFFILSLQAFSQHSRKLTLKSVTDSIPKLMEEQHIAGLMLGIVTRDSVIFSGGFGYADLENQRMADEHTLFRLGSITKMFVSLGILQLIREGKLTLNTELKVIAPEIPFQNPWEPTHPVRIIHLLEHTSGFDDMKLNRQYALDEIGYHAENVAMVHKNSFVCRWKPGERLSYSNPNYTLLGHIIKKLSGKPYDEYLKELILSPLGMASSNFNLTSKSPNVDVKEYVFSNGEMKPVPSVTLIGGPQGALWSSSNDMTKFIQMLLRNGSPLFPDTMIHEMEVSHSSLGARAGLKNSYALGNATGFFQAKYPFHGHSGLTGTCFSDLLYNRDLGVGFIIATNSNVPPYRISELIVSYLLQDVPDPASITQALDLREIEPFTGYYQFESPRNEIIAFTERIQNLQEIYIDNGSLYMKQWFGHPVKLVQTGPLTFTWEGNNTPAIIFTKNEDGEKVMSILGSYFLKKSTASAFAFRYLLLVAILFACLSLPMALVSLVLAALKKIDTKTLAQRCMPVSACLMLVWAVVGLLDVQQRTYLLSELDSINYRTISIFLGTLMFAILSIVSFIDALKEFLSSKRSWPTWYFLITCVSLCFILAILLVNGWIGLRTWAM